MTAFRWLGNSDITMNVPVTWLPQSVIPAYDIRITVTNPPSDAPVCYGATNPTVRPS